MRIHVWLMAVGGILFSGCSGLAFFAGGMGGAPPWMLLCNLICLAIGVSMVSYAVATGSSAGPSARAYLRDVRRRKYTAAQPIRFHCPACGRQYTGTAELANTTFTCRAKACGQSFPVNPDPASEPPAAQ